MEKNKSKDNQETLQLHKEELQITKKWIETTDVKIYKKTYTEEKQIVVPVTCEELIIEKRDPGESEKNIETIRIPLIEERIEITLHPTILENVEIYKKQLEEIIHVNETVKEEKGHINIVGDLKLMEEN